MSESRQFDEALRLAAHASENDRSDFGQRVEMTYPVFPGAQARSIEILERSVVKITKDRHLPSLPFRNGVTLIKSAKNTGKTTALEPMLKDATKSVLVVGHRISLVRKASQQFNLACYEDGFDDQRRFAVTLDSVFKVQTKKPYDIVVVDESEQLLRHFFSDTMVSRQNQCIRALDFLLHNASHVVALDADLCWASLNFFGRTEGTEILLNETSGTPHPLYVHSKKGDLLDEVIKAVGCSRCFVVSDQKSTLKRLRDRLLDEGVRQDQILLISSDTGHNPNVTRFLRSPEAEARRYRVVLASPTISAGIDISFLAEQPVFERLFGIFDGRDITHFEADQLLSRVRNPGRVDVWMTKKAREPKGSGNYGSTSLPNPEMEIRRKVDSLLRNTTLLGFDETGKPNHCTDHPLIGVAQTVETTRYRSRQFFREHFIDHKRAQGCTIEVVRVEPKNNDTNDTETSLFKLVKALSERPNSQTAANQQFKKAQAIVALLEAAGLIARGQFSTEVFSNATLHAFQHEARKRSDYYEMLFGIRFNAALNKQPVKIVKMILKKIEIETAFKNKSTVNGKTVYYYEIDPNSACFASAPIEDRDLMVDDRFTFNTIPASTIE